MAGDVPAWAALALTVLAAVAGWAADRARMRAIVDQTKAKAEHAESGVLALVDKLADLASKIDIATDRLTRLTQSVDEHLGRYARKFNDQSSVMHRLDKRLYSLEVRAGIPTAQPEEHTPLAWAYEHDRPTARDRNEQ